MTTEDRKANDLNELVKTALALAEQMRQSGLTMKTAVQSLLGEGCTEKDILAIANEAKRLTYSNPQLAFTLVQLGRETAIRIWGFPKKVDAYKRQIEYTCFGGNP